MNESVIFQLNYRLTRIKVFTYLAVIGIFGSVTPLSHYMSETEIQHLFSKGLIKERITHKRYKDKKKQCRKNEGYKSGKP